MTKHQSGYADSTITVNLDSIVANWRFLDSLSAPSTKTAAMVKANGYGLDSGAVATALAAAGGRGCEARTPTCPLGMDTCTSPGSAGPGSRAPRGCGAASGLRLKSGLILTRCFVSSFFAAARRCCRSHCFLLRSHHAGGAGSGWCSSASTIPPTAASDARPPRWPRWAASRCWRATR